MSDKNLFLGDTTYPHDSRATEYLRSKFGASRGHFAWRDIEDGFNAGLKEANKYSAERITQLEQVERRYEYMRKLNVPQFAKIYMQNIAGEMRFDELIDSLINEGK